MTSKEAHWILFPFRSHLKITERQLLGQCKSKEKLTELLNNEYIVLLPEDESGRSYALAQKAKSLFTANI